MNAFTKLHGLSLAIAGLLCVPVFVSPARADDDDWRERREEYFEELEERHEEAREEAEERWEDEQERLEELREDGVIVGPRPWRRHYAAPPGAYLPPPERYDGYYRAPPIIEETYPVYEEYWDGPRVHQHYAPYPYTYRYYGAPGFGYSEYPRGGRSVQVGPVQVFWYR